MARPLRSVPPADVPPVPPADVPRTVAAAAAADDQRAVLVTMRARVAAAIDDERTMARDLAALTRRLLEIVGEIEAFDVAAAGDKSVVAPTADESWDAAAI